MPARSLGMTFGADADDALRQQIHNDPRPPLATHCDETLLDDLVAHRRHVTY